MDSASDFTCPLDLLQLQKKKYLKKCIPIYFSYKFLSACSVYYICQFVWINREKYILRIPCVSDIHNLLDEKLQWRIRFSMFVCMVCIDIILITGQTLINQRITTSRGQALLSSFKFEPFADHFLALWIARACAYIRQLKEEGWKYFCR